MRVETEGPALWLKWASSGFDLHRSSTAHSPQSDSSHSIQPSGVFAQISLERSSFAFFVGSHGRAVADAHLPKMAMRFQAFQLETYRLNAVLQICPQISQQASEGLEGGVDQRGLVWIFAKIEARLGSRPHGT